VEAIRRSGGQAAVAIGDLSNDEGAARAAEAALAAFDGIDILVNNAGAIHIAAMNNDGGPFARQPCGDPGAYSRTGACDERALAFELQVHEKPSLRWLCTAHDTCRPLAAVNVIASPYG